MEKKRFYTYQLKGFIEVRPITGSLRMVKHLHHPYIFRTFGKDPRNPTKHLTGEPKHSTKNKPSTQASPKVTAAPSISSSTSRFSITSTSSSSSSATVPTSTKSDYMIYQYIIPEQIIINKPLFYLKL